MSIKENSYHANYTIMSYVAFTDMSINKLCVSPVWFCLQGLLINKPGELCADRAQTGSRGIPRWFLGNPPSFLGNPLQPGSLGLSGLAPRKAKQTKAKQT